MVQLGEGGTLALTARQQFDLGVHRDPVGPAPDRHGRLGRHRPRAAGPIPGSVEPLGSGTLAPKQIQFSNNARVLVVDEAGSSTIDTFVVGRDGRPGQTVTTPSVGGGPFGFDFDRAGYLLVSDAALTTGQSGATSLRRLA